MPEGMTSTSARAKQASRHARTRKNRFWLHTYAAPSRHASGNRTWNAALAVMVNRYFSKKMAHRTMRKYPLRSASFSATGVAMSPGSSVMAAEAAVEAAVSSSTVVCFS